jgi:phospholipid/cholesterol/gamma-HCH transport system substrate-binding protein
MKFSKEARVGILVTVALAALIWGINYLKGKDFFTTSNTYYAIYNNVDGLVKSNPVVMSGFRIGIINKIEFLEDKSGRLLVTMLINRNIFVSHDATANIISSDLLGSKAMKIELGTDKNKAADGDTLFGIVESSLSSRLGKQVGPVKDKVESLVVSLDSLTEMLQQLFDPQTRRNLKAGIDHLNNSMSSLDNMMSNDGKINRMFSNVESLTSNLQNHNKQLATILENFSSISDSIAKSQLQSAINNATQALAEFNLLVQKVNKGEGSLGLLINDKNLYTKLETASGDLDLLLKDLKANPKRYISFSVFGKKTSATK